MLAIRFTILFCHILVTQHCRRGLSCRIRRADLYSCSLRIGYVARCGLAVSLSLMAMAAAFNKCAPDLLTKPAALSSRWSCATAGLVFPGEAGEAAAATSLGDFAPQLLPRSDGALSDAGGKLEDLYRRDLGQRLLPSAAPTATERCWWSRFGAGGQLVVDPLFGLDCVDDQRRLRVTRSTGMFPGRRATAFSGPPAAGYSFGSQSHWAMVLSRVLRWRAVTLDAGRPGGFVVFSCLREGFSAMFLDTWCLSFFLLGSACVRCISGMVE